jgi:tryptophan synthase beta chain
VEDGEVLGAFQLLAETEGIIAALEPAHAVAYVLRAVASGEITKGSTVLITMSGRGDKDVAEIMELMA